MLFFSHVSDCMNDGMELLCFYVVRVEGVSHDVCLSHEVLIVVLGGGSCLLDRCAAVGVRTVLPPSTRGAIMACDALRRVRRQGRGVEASISRGCLFLARGCE